ncbi:MAG: uracil phosphoribosyltransferase [Saprospiraceae bacterium]
MPLFLLSEEHKDGSLEVQNRLRQLRLIDDAVLILCDPMLATGSSVILTLERLLQEGTPRSIHVASVIASKAGVEALRRRRFIPSSTLAGRH